MNLDSDAAETGNIHDPKPLLIYDGSCGFCKYWVHYWQKLTGDKVDYKPYQEVGSQYPQISTEEFRSAVQYVAPDGTISRAAKASFLTLSNAPGKKCWLTLYRKLPGFAFISEKIYGVIARHRDSFYSPSILLWGRNYEPPRYDLISWLFLRGLGVLFFIAFLSFGMQAMGLIGSHGIIPVPRLINAAKAQIGGFAAYWNFPMLFWFNSNDLFIKAVCWGGVGVSLLLIFNILPRLSLLLLYVLYLSLCCAGLMFMSFQWDMLLLETAIISIFLLWSSGIGIWLLRWLLFRYILMSGLVKILSGDPAWRHLTALSYYFTTAPLPTPLAWYAAHLPPALLTAATFLALFIEIVLPFLFFFPRKLRFFAGFAILFMQVLISITGNYNFFNLTTMLLCLTLFDDAAIRKIIPQGLAAWITRHAHYIQPRKMFYVSAAIFIAITVPNSLAQIYLRVASSYPTSLIYFASSIAPLRIVNTYGPFAVITTKRMEIVLEGTTDGINWKEYNFKYKPGDVMRRPQWNIPLQPRVDWQMWFAALGSPEQNPWFLYFIQRLLQNSPDVTALLETNPFPDSPPLHIRAKFYEYDFTTSEEKAATGAWWKRTLTGLYLP